MMQRIELNLTLNQIVFSLSNCTALVCTLLRFSGFWLSWIALLLK